MKRHLFALLLCLLAFTGYAQETPPTIGPNFKVLSTSQFYIQLPDSAIWQYKGVTYGWAKLGRYRDITRLRSTVDSLLNLETLQKVTDRDSVTTRSVFTGGLTVGDTLRANMLITVKGSSIAKTVGYGGVTNAKDGFIYKTSNLIGFRYLNNGIGGRTMNGPINNGTSFLNTRGDVPVYVPGDYLLFDCLINDSRQDSTVYTPAIYRTNLNLVIDSAIGKGWPVGHIILANMAYYNDPTAPVYPHVEERHDQYSAVMLDVATIRGLKFYDGYYTFKTAYLLDNSLLYTDILHPTATGHTLIANNFAAYLATFITPVDITEQKIFGANALKIGGNATIIKDLNVNGDATVGNGITASETDKEGFYLDGTNVRIRRNRLTIGDGSASQVRLYLNSNITGASTSSNIYTDAKIQSDVTQRAFTLRSATAADIGVTVPDLSEIYLQNGTNGAGGSFVLKYGVRVINAWANATTSNSAFRGEINTGTGKKNLDISGTALNYINGNLGLGIDPARGRLEIGTGGTGVYPVILNSAALHTTRLAGAIEFLTDSLYFTQTTGAKRQSLAYKPYVDAQLLTYLPLTGGTLTGALNNTGNITGVTTSGSYQTTGIIQSGVTTQGYGFKTTLGTQATSFTLTDMVHFNATQGTIGAGSTVTNQYGFKVESSVAGGTNVYGFHSNITAGANKWNLYLQSTAKAFINGALLIGSATDNGQKLQVNGRIRVLQGLAGTAGTDSILVHDNTSKEMKLISPTYYAPTSLFTYGRYTPTVTDDGNVTSSTPYSIHYKKVGTEVTVSGSVDLVITGAGGVVVYLTLPVASNFTDVKDLAGVVTSTISVSAPPNVFADPTGDKIRLAFTTVGAGSLTLNFTCVYEVK